MDVAADVAGLAAEDEADLGVGFEVFHPVDDLGAGALELVGAGEVPRFVEAGFELDEGGDVFAVFGGFDEGVDDAGLARGAVEDLLDGDDVGIGGGFLDEAYDGIEGFVGVVEEDVAGGYGLEHGDAGGDGGAVLGRPFLIAQVVEVLEEGELHEGGEAKGAGVAVDFLGSGGGDGSDHAGEIAGGIGADLEADGIGEAAGGEDVLHFIGEIGGVLFLDGDVTVACDAEGGGGLHVLSGKKAPGVGGDEVLDEDEGMCLILRGDGDAAGKVLVYGDEDVAGGLVGGIEQAAGEDDVEGGDGRRGGVRIDGEGGEERGDAVLEDGGGLGALGVGELGRGEEDDAFLSEGGDEGFVEEVVLVGVHCQNALADGCEVADRGEAGVVPGLPPAAPLEHEGADTDLEELVHVRGGDGEELDALEEGHVGFQGLVEDTLVEFEPGEFAVVVFGHGGKALDLKFETEEGYASVIRDFQ